MIALAVRHRRYPTTRFALLGLVAMLFTFGSDLPLFPLMSRWVPGVALFRGPNRALIFCSFAAAVLAGSGLDVLWTLSDPIGTLVRKRWRPIAVAAACLGPASILFLGWGLRPSPERIVHLNWNASR